MTKHSEVFAYGRTGMKIPGMRLIKKAEGKGNEVPLAEKVIEWHIPGGKNEGEKIPEVDRRPDVHLLNRENGEAR